MITKDKIFKGMIILTIIGAVMAITLGIRHEVLMTIEKHKWELEQDRDHQIKEAAKFRTLYLESQSTIEKLKGEAANAHNQVLIAEQTLKKARQHNRNLLDKNEKLLYETLNAITRGDTTVINRERSKFRDYIRSRQ